MEPLVWTTYRVTLSELHGYDKNPRKITDEAKQQLRASIEEFNVVEIPVADLDRTLLTWHQRAESMVDIGRGNEEIDVRLPNRALTEQEKAKYNLIANRHSGEFDIEKLQLNFDENLLFEVGFTAEELNNEAPALEINDIDTNDFKLEEMELKSFEHQDYLVIACDNVNDFMKMVTMFGLSKVNASFVAKKNRPGIGRVIPVQTFFDRIDG